MNNLTELEKFKKVNSCETIEELTQCILDFADEYGLIQGRTHKFNAQEMAQSASACYKNKMFHFPELVTREFGLRQQLLYLKHYNNEK